MNAYVLLWLAQVFDTSDLPGGVVNIVTGDRDHLSKYLVEHQNVEAMWYFGTAEGSRFVEEKSAVNVKRTWVNYGLSRDWEDPVQGHGPEFLYHVVECKNIWMPMGEIFANWLLTASRTSFWFGQSYKPSSHIWT